MSPYHSKFDKSTLQICNMALLPLRTSFRGPAPKCDGEDIIDEVLEYFKANMFFRRFEIKSAADRVLIYLTLYIVECLKRLQKCSSKTEGLKEMSAFALDRCIPIPGDQGFPMNSHFKGPANADQEEALRSYLQQLRQELGVRLCEKVFDPATDKPLKWWTSFGKRKFLDLTLIPPGM
ncbi:Actin-related protein 2/3 complex subunit 3 [Trichinella britovi]|uniref:Actin-related protein 2/3 complex subunit 3 n=1 Tax=Trichinella britovi TaxID=45882 RepID=A0A0V1D0D6_TRIBR|nr:Actin-related protein 2/3 complex subunit 3 [Trichinella britovi]